MTTPRTTMDEYKERQMRIFEEMFPPRVWGSSNSRGEYKCETGLFPMPKYQHHTKKVINELINYLPRDLCNIIERQVKPSIVEELKEISRFADDDESPIDVINSIYELKNRWDYVYKHRYMFVDMFSKYAKMSCESKICEGKRIPLGLLSIIYFYWVIRESRFIDTL